MSADQPRWQRAAALSELSEHAALPVRLGEQELVLCLLDGHVRALQGICTHEFAYLSDGFVEAGCIECPLHQARFDLRTGAVREGPADEPLRVFPVRVEDGEVLVGL